MGGAHFPLSIEWNIKISGEAQPLIAISGDVNLSSPGVHSDTNNELRL